jgi:uncharacterized protein (DUF1501 family)
MSRIHFQKRRDFIKGASCLVASGAASSFVPQLSLMGSAMAQSVTSNYKALVCIYLDGGNDSWNVVIPADASRHGEYVAARGGLFDTNIGPSRLAIPLSGSIAGVNLPNALPLAPAGNPVLNDGRQYALNPSVPGLQTLFNNRRLSFVANVGPLVEPLRKSNFTTYRRPPQLYSHNDQTSLWQIGTGNSSTNPNGWGGMLAGRLLNTPPASGLPPCISIAGQTRFLVGEYPAGAAVFPYRLSTNATTPASSLTNYADTDPAGAKRREVLQSLVDLNYPQPMSSEYGDILDRSMNLSINLNAQIQALNTNPLFNTAQPGNSISFNTAVTNIPTTGLGNQLKQVARMIAVSRFGIGAIPTNRQVFFVRTGGYDTHDGQIPSLVLTAGHQGLIQQVSAAMAAFDTAMTVLNNLQGYVGVVNEVVTFTMSEFSRTINSNGNGTDHAWGAIQMVMGAPTTSGGPLAGGQMFGRYPWQVLGRTYPGGATSTPDLGGECFNRGEFLPTTSVDQMAATFARWMGVSNLDLPALFPNIDNFVTPPGSNPNAAVMAQNTRTLPFLSFA